MILELKNTYKFFPGKEEVIIGLDNISFEIKNPSLNLIVGKNGSGKSTLLNIISGISRKDKGDILFNNQLLNYDNVSYLKHDYNVIDHLSIYDNVYEVFLLNNERFDKFEIDNLISLVGLKNEENTKVKNLSEGEKQRLSMARVLLKNTPIFIFDEPTAKLDDYNAEIIISVINKLSDNSIVLVATHDERFFKIADRIITLDKGKIIKDEIINDSNIKPERDFKVNNSNNCLKLSIKLFGLDFVNKPLSFLLKSLVLALFFLLGFVIMYFFYFDNNYDNKFENYVIVSKQENEVFLESDIKDLNENIDVEKVYNGFVSYRIETVSINEYSPITLYSSSELFEKEDLLLGRPPEKNDEIVLDATFLNYYDKPTDNFSNDSLVKNMKIVGISKHKNYIYKDYFFKLLINEVGQSIILNVKNDSNDLLFHEIFTNFIIDNSLDNESYKIQIGKDFQLDDNLFEQFKNKSNIYYINSFDNKFSIEIKPEIEIVDNNNDFTFISNEKVLLNFINNFKDEFYITNYDFNENYLLLRFNNYRDFNRFSTQNKDYTIISENYITREYYDKYIIFYSLIFISLIALIIKLINYIKNKIVASDQLKLNELRKEIGASNQVLSIYKKIYDATIIFVALIFSIILLFIIKILNPIINLKTKNIYFIILIFVFGDIVVKIIDIVLSIKKVDFQLNK